MSLSAQIFVQDENGRRQVSSLLPFFGLPGNPTNIMDPALISKNRGQYCRWAGFIFTKGVTDATVVEPISVLSLHTEMVPTLHGLLIQGFPGVDGYPWCYHSDEGPGFGGFVRWAYFFDPTNARDLVAIDFDPSASPFIGKARGFSCVAAIAHALLLQGMPESTELVLANAAMLEDGENYRYRNAHQLFTVLDWSQRF